MVPHCGTAPPGFNTTERQIVTLFAVVEQSPGGAGGRVQKVGAGKYTTTCAGSRLDACITEKTEFSTVALPGKLVVFHWSAGSPQVAQAGRAAVAAPCSAA